MAVNSPPSSLGTPCPDFDLPAVVGPRRALADFAKSRALLIVFTCNHCPYAQAVEDRIIGLARAYPEQDLQVVGICSNDAVAYPDDAPAHLAERWHAKNYGFPYLHDDSQAVARAFGAVCTPDFFLFGPKRELVYRGRLDDNWRDARKVQHAELKEAIDGLLAGKPAVAQQFASIGCSIKWRE